MAARGKRCWGDVSPGVCFFLRNPAWSFLGRGPCIFSTGWSFSARGNSVLEFFGAELSHAGGADERKTSNWPACPFWESK